MSLRYEGIEHLGYRAIDFDSKPAREAINEAGLKLRAAEQRIATLSEFALPIIAEATSQPQLGDIAEKLIRVNVGKARMARAALAGGEGGDAKP